MNSSDLTTLANTKGWLGITTSSAATDALLARLITSQSVFFQSCLDRTIASRAYTEYRDGIGFGDGRYSMRFDNYPVSAFTSLTVNGQAITASSDGGVLAAGYGFDAAQVWIAPGSVAGGFTRGRRNVVMSYTGGFLVLPDGAANTTPELLPAEVWAIPATPFQIRPALTWLSNNSVSFTGGATLTKVTSGPITGQYSVDATGLYTFAAADAARSVSLSYSYVPSDIEQAVITLVGYRYKEKDRISDTSKTVGNTKVTFNVVDIPPDALTTLNQYKRVFAYA